MEKIKVNMSPNPLDVQTIHASQNDNEGREWGFELHNNGEKIDSSSISDQMVFKAYEGGTEEILPTNGSTPTTSPFKGDIRYPQGLLSDQEFLYRENPTEEDGLAKITDIKGNTLVWNQLMQNITGTTASNWVTTGGTLTVSGDTLLYATTSVETDGNNRVRTPSTLSLKNGHKYIYSVMHKESKTGLKFAFSGFVSTGYVYVDSSTSWVTSTVLITETQDKNWAGFSIRKGTSDVAVNDTFDVKNSMIIDLTQMFGSGNEPTTVEEFTSLFPLSYYAYNQGSLLSFNGTGIKTTGKNLWTPYSTQTQNGITMTANGDGTYKFNGTATANAFFSISNANLPSAHYYIAMFNQTTSTYVHMACQSANGSYPVDATLGSVNRKYNGTFDAKVLIIWVNSGTTLSNFIIKPYIGLVDTDTFEPYTSSTLSLPISTYFPTGMKSAGTVYDELTPRKAITRIGAVDLGTLSWTWQPTWQAWYTYQMSVSLKGASDNDTKPNIVSANYPTLALNNILGTNTFGISTSNVSTGNKLITVENGSDTVTPTGYLYYELATPTETSFTTASLVTENAEIPLSNEDGVLIGKCTEELSAEPGFIDAKIKLSDGDGTCYSNKIQLHVERSPQ